MAGSVPTISTRITLDGAEDVTRQLKEVGQSGERALKQIQGAGSALGDGGKRASEQLKQIGLHAIEGERGTTRVREGLHALRAVLGETGGRFGALAQVTGLTRAGFLALPAAIGAGVVALANIEAQARRTEEAMKGVYGVKAPEALSQAKQGANDLGRSAGEFAGQMQAIQHLEYLRGPSPETGGMSFPERSEATGKPWKPPEGSAVAKIFAQNLNSPEGQRAFLENFDMLLRGTGATPEASSKAIGSVLDTWTKQAESGKQVTLTPEIVKSIYAASPEAARRIAGGLGATGANGTPSAEQLEFMTGSGYVWTPEQLSSVMASLAPQAREEFRRRPQSVGERISTATNAATNALEPLVSPPPENVAAQQSNYERYLAARRGYATQPPGGQPAPSVDLKSDFSAFQKAVGDFGQWVAALTQKTPAQERAIAAVTPHAPEGFPQGEGSGLVSTPSVPPPVPSGRQTAIVERDPKTGEVKVIQPDQEHAEGGIIRGPGTGTSDSILMSLRPGGFVLNAASTERVQEILRASGYADGGKVLARVSNGERYFAPEEVQKIGLPALHALNAIGLASGGDVDIDDYLRDAGLHSQWLDDSPEAVAKAGRRALAQMRQHQAWV